jgi:hypothetical protein
LDALQQCLLRVSENFTIWAEIANPSGRLSQTKQLLYKTGSVTAA